jgi:hypothetical protein
MNLSANNINTDMYINVSVNNSDLREPQPTPLFLGPADLTNGIILKYNESYRALSRKERKKYHTPEQLAHNHSNTTNCKQFKIGDKICTVNPDHENAPFLYRCRSIFHRDCRTDYFYQAAGKVAFRLFNLHGFMANNENFDPTRVISNYAEIPITIFEIIYRARTGAAITEAQIKNALTDRIKKLTPEVSIDTLKLGLEIYKHSWSDSDPTQPDLHFHCLLSPVFVLNGKVNIFRVRSFFETYFGDKVESITEHYTPRRNNEALPAYFGRFRGMLQTRIVELMKKPLDLLGNIQYNPQTGMIDYTFNRVQQSISVEGYANLIFHYKRRETAGKGYGYLSNKTWLTDRRRYFPYLLLHRDERKDALLRAPPQIDIFKPDETPNQTPLIDVLIELEEYIPSSAMEKIHLKHLLKRVRKEIARIQQIVYCCVVGCEGECEVLWHKEPLPLGADPFENR